jgi:hypothetical protein
MTRIEMTIRRWQAQAFDAQVAAIEAQDQAKLARLERAEGVLDQFLANVHFGRDALGIQREGVRN